MNLADYVLIAVLVLVLFLAVRAMLKRRGGCSCGCGGCVHASACHAKKSSRTS